MHPAPTCYSPPRTPTPCRRHSTPNGMRVCRSPWSSLPVGKCCTRCRARWISWRCGAPFRRTWKTKLTPATHCIGRSNDCLSTHVRNYGDVSGNACLRGAPWARLCSEPRPGYPLGRERLPRNTEVYLRNAALSSRQNALDALGVFFDLVLHAGEHADVNAVRRLDAFEGRAESLVHAAIGNPSRGQNLESETRLPGLPHHAIHARRIALQIDIAGHFQHLAVEGLLPLFGRARAVVDATGVEIHVPALLLHLRDHFRLVRAHSHQHAQIARLLAPFLHGIHLAGLVCLVHHLALPLQSQRLQRLHQHRRLDAGGHLNDRSEECRVGKECRSRWSPYH